ncbi:MAG: gas vesicle protein GvpD [Methanomassiliicoccales archaeon]|jgi:KaiC/GvpD/RAD55 family RecA-like ATPase|nr:gas vesicle protein GvpD [Methanomassiliicoccales archaeon]
MACRTGEFTGIEKTENPGARLPPEILSFFMKEGGHSLILRGNAGTGKTTFALQTIEELSAVEKSYYLSTRVSDNSLFTQFPWLKEKFQRGETSRLTIASNATIEEKDQKDRQSGLVELKGIKGLSGKETKISLTIGKDLSELEAIYRVVESDENSKHLIVIDSIDALAQKYGETCARIMLTIQGDLVEGYGTNVLFVLESADPQLDYLGDGVVLLRSLEYQNRRLREIEIMKLRGCEIQQMRYLFTLSGGRIQSFGRTEDIDVSLWKGWSPIPDAGERVSCGIGDIDRMLGGGLERGSIVLLELGRAIPTSVSTAIENSMVANFVAQGRGVIWVPMRKASAESLRNRMVGIVGEGDFEKNVRIPEKATQIGTAAKYVLPVEGSTAYDDFSWQNLAFALQASSPPYLTLMGFDTMESIYGTKVMDQLADFLASVRRSKGIFVGIAPPSAESTQRIADLATIHLKIDRVGGTVILYGEKPFTGCNAFTFVEKEIGGHISLIPIL